QRQRSAKDTACRVLALALLGAAGCSGSSSNAKIGVGREGFPCDAVNACQSGLRCVASLFTVNVCGRPCGGAGDCKSGERCYSYSDQPRDGHCVNIVTNEYAICGVSDTSLCGNGRSCLYLPQQAHGLCVSTCSLDGSSGAGADEDAGSM